MQIFFKRKTKSDYYCKNQNFKNTICRLFHYFQPFIIIQSFLKRQKPNQTKKIQERTVSYQQQLIMKQSQVKTRKQSTNNLVQSNQQFPPLKQKTLGGSYLYTPTQYLISNFLTTKKNIEDDLINTLKGFSQMKSNQEVTSLQLSQKLNYKKKQLLGIKRKLNKSCQEQLEIYDVMKKRINRHQNLSFKRYQNHNNPNSSQKQLNGFLSKSPSKNQTNILLTKNSSQNIQVNQESMFNDNQNRKNKISITQSQLNLNKQIAFFMLNNSMILQNRLRQKQVLYQKLNDLQIEQRLKKQRQQQEDKRQNQLSQNNYNNQQLQNKDQNIQKQQSQQIIEQQSNVQPQNHQINLQSSQQQNIQHNLFSQVFGLQRFFQMQDIQLESIEQLHDKNSIMDKVKNNIKQQENNQTINIKNAINRKLDQYKDLTQNTIFNQQEFIKALEKHDNGEPMDIENNQNNLQIKSQSIAQNQQKKLLSESKPTYFQGQIQLQCMLYQKQKTISSQILSNSLQQINKFLYENSHMIKKYESDLQFWVILCKSINLLKTKDIVKQMQGIELIRNKLYKMKSQIEEWHRIQLQKITSMLLYDQSKIQIQPYLKKAQQSFRQVFQQIYRLPDVNLFLHRIYTGALILKTPSCCQKSKQNPLICPLCNPLSQKAFSKIPILTRNLSNLICRINGSVMDHQNYPIMLPSNQIYSFNGLQQTKRIKKGNGGKFNQQYYCKITTTWYMKEEAKKVYLA